MEDQILLTPSALFDFLRQIDELADKDVSVDASNGDLTVYIGDSCYQINTNNAEEFEVEEETLEDIQAINDDTCEELIAEGEAYDEQPVSGGIIKELAKSLLVGGLVRLSAKLLKK